MKAKIKLLFILSGIFSAGSYAQQVQNIGQLFDSLKAGPATRALQFDADKALQYKKIARGNLYPNIFAFGRYNYSSSPTGMLPVPPNDLIRMVKDPSAAQPFSENIWRGGASLSMPLFVMSVYTTSAKARTMYQAASLKAGIELQKNEAILVGANANLSYMEKLETAIQSKRKSLEKMQELIEIKVNNGRAPESASLKMHANINELGLRLSQLQINKAKVRAIIQNLTNIQMDSAVSLTQNAEFVHGDFVVLKPLKKMIKATRLRARAEREKLYPALIAQANYVHNHAKSYNNDNIVNNDYTTAGLMLKIPIFEKAQYSKIKLNTIEVAEKENELEKTRIEITAQAAQLENSLVFINKSIQLNEESIQSKQELLSIAKESYLKDRMTIEDYLKYEDDLLFEKASLYKTQAERWQTLMQLAVIYGNNIENLVR